MKSLVKKLGLFLLTLTLFFFARSQVLASDPIPSWGTTTPLPQVLASHTTVSYNGRVYVIAGASTTVDSLSYYADTNPDGTLQNWNSSPAAPPVFQQASAIKDNHVYLLGGNEYPPTNSQTSVYLGNIDNSGPIPSWSNQPDLPLPSALGGSAIHGDTIYYAGGLNSQNGGDVGVRTEIYKSTINSDGTLGSWTSAGSLPQALFGFGMVVHGDHVIIFGGTDSNYHTLSTSYTAPINPDGTIGSWQSTSTLPGPVFRSGVAVQHGSVDTIITIGGYDYDSSTNVNKVYAADINSDGTLAPWQESHNPLPDRVCCSSATISNNYLYLPAGYSSDFGYTNTVYYTPTPLNTFHVTNLTFNHTTQQYSFDYTGYTGGDITGESVAIHADNESWGYNHEPATCSGGSSGSGSCSGTFNQVHGTYSCSAGTIYVQIYGFHLGGLEGGLANPDPSCSSPTPTPTLTPSPSPTPTPTPAPQLTSLSPAKVWVGLKNSDDVGVKFDVKAEVYVGSTLVSSGETDSVAAGSSGFNNAKLDTINFGSFSAVNFPSGTTLTLKLYVRNACVGSGHNSGTARLWYNDSQANSLFDANINGNDSNYYLVSSAMLSTSVGSGPKQTIDVAAGAKCSAFKQFGSWSVTP